MREENMRDSRMKNAESGLNTSNSYMETLATVSQEPLGEKYRALQTENSTAVEPSWEEYKEKSTNVQSEVHNHSNQS